MLKLIYFALALIFFPLTSFANVCDDLKKNIESHEEKLAVAKLALDSADMYCRREDYPNLCYQQIRDDYIASAENLKQSKLNFKNSGCGYFAPTSQNIANRFNASSSRTVKRFC